MIIYISRLTRATKNRPENELETTKEGLNEFTKNSQRKVLTKLVEYDIIDKLI